MKKKHYCAPTVYVVELMVEGVVCTSTPSTNTSMNVQYGQEDW